jgi:hypothetical protein
VTRWPELVDSLILGTQFGTLAGGTVAPELELLRNLALAGASRRAGYVPHAVKSMPEIDPAPTETLPACSLAAVDALRRVLDQAYTQDLARDWFLYIRGRGKRVPHVALSYVLHLTVQFTGYEPYVVPVLGARGRWMVERMPAFASLRQPELWENASAELPGAELNTEYEWIRDLMTQARDLMMEALAHE